MKQFVRLAAASATLLAVLAMLAATAGAGRPVFNPVCLGTKIEGGESGTYAMPFGAETGTITIAVEDTPSGPVFSFATDDPSHVVGSVDVKGGTSLNTYDLVTVDTPNGVSSASGLHAAINPTNGTWYGISYLCFATGKVVYDGGGEL